MNVLIITEEDVFYVHEFFRLFFPIAAQAGYHVKAITILAPFNKRSPIALAKQMYGFYGPVHFMRMGFLYVFKKVTGRTIRTLALKNHIQVLETKNVNDPAYIRTVQQMNVDVIVSIAAPQIFKKDILQAARFGCINSHSALLPENRGMMPVFWGMYKDAKEIGVTIHYMDQKLDAGAIIRQERVPVENATLHELILKTKQISARLIDETLRDIMTGKTSTVPMPEGGSYQTFPTPEEVREFKKRGKKLF